MPKLFQQYVTAYLVVISTVKITLISYKLFFRMNHFTACFNEYCSTVKFEYNYAVFFAYFLCTVPQ